MTELSHIETIEKELQQIESSNAWNQVYQKVRSDGTYNFPLTEARTPTNRILNRYRDVLPYDHSRILLQHPITDYINASLVKVESINRQYILTQGPLSTTSQHFWLMVWQQQCKGIVMLNKIIEKNMVKCDQYWPLGVKNGGQDTVRFDGVGLSVELVSEAKHHHYIYRTLRLTETSTGNNREVLHFHFTTWPDFGVPQSPEAFSKFLSVVIKSGCLDPSVGPPIVHCSAGIGRSGTFCLVDTLLVMLERGLCSNNVGTVLEVLLDMRRYRMGLIQTPDQLRFSYQAIVHGGRQRLQRQEQRLTNGSLGNGTATTGDSDSSEVEEEGGEEDVPPPRPPPRTDSLTRSMIDAQMLLEDQLQQGDDDVESEEDETDEDDNSDQDGPPPPVESNNVLHDSMADRSLPAVPPSPVDPTPPPRPRPAAPAPTENNGHGGGIDSPSSPEMLAARMASEVRRRRQQERSAAISSLVSGIKEGIKDQQKAAEEWDRRKRGSEGADGDGQGPSKRAKH